MQFSLILPVYCGDKEEWLIQALQSIKQQTCPPTEIIVVKDGILPNQLDKVFADFSKILPLKIAQLPKQQGLANAINQGLKLANYEWVARFDADDINIKDRFQKQLSFAKKNPEVALIGGWCLEFINDIKGPYKLKKIPLSYEQVRKLAKKRNPINHQTVMYRRSAVIKAGGYEDYNAMEDYHLWVKMLLQGFRLINIPEKLVLQRAGKDLHFRRGGLNYLKTEIRLNCYFLKKGFINPLEFIRNIAIRFVIRMIPVFCRRWIYNFIRKNIQKIS